MIWALLFYMNLMVDFCKTLNWVKNTSILQSLNNFHLNFLEIFHFFFFCFSNLNFFSISFCFLFNTEPLIFINSPLFFCPTKIKYTGCYPFIHLYNYFLYIIQWVFLIAFLFPTSTKNRKKTLFLSIIFDLTLRQRIFHLFLYLLYIYI